METSISKGSRKGDLTENYLYSRTAPEVEDDGLVHMMAENADGLEAIHIAYDKEWDRIGHEVLPDLQREAVSQARAQAVKHVERLRVPLDQLQKAMGRSAEILHPQVRQQIPADADASDWRQAEAEARTHLRDMKDVDQRLVYLEACRTCDRQTIRAFELAPSVAPLVDAETIAEGAELFAATNAAEEYAMLVQQRTTLASIQGDINRATREIGVAVDVGELVASG